MGLKAMKGAHINGVPQRWEDFDRIYMDGTEAIYHTSLNASQKAAKFGFVVEKNGTHIPSIEPNNTHNPANLLDKMMKGIDPNLYATSPEYKREVDQRLRAAFKMGYEESPQPDYLNRKKQGFRPGF